MATRAPKRRERFGDYRDFCRPNAPKMVRTTKLDGDLEFSLNQVIRHGEQPNTRT